VAGVFLEFFERRNLERKVRRFWLGQVIEKGFEFLEGALVESAVSLDVLGSTRTSRGFCLLVEERTFLRHVERRVDRVEQSVRRCLRTCF